MTCGCVKCGFVSRRFVGVRFHAVYCNAGSGLPGCRGLMRSIAFEWVIRTTANAGVTEVRQPRPSLRCSREDRGHTDAATPGSKVSQEPELGRTTMPVIMRGALVSNDGPIEDRDNCWRFKWLPANRFTSHFIFR